MNEAAPRRIAIIGSGFSGPTNNWPHTTRYWWRTRRVDLGLHEAKPATTSARAECDRAAAA